MNREKLMEQLEIDEGKRRRMYLDTATPPRWTAGVGRNISDRDFSDDEIALMLKNDIDLIVSQLDRSLPWWRQMSDARQNALANMCMMGIGKLLGFKRALAAMQAGRWVLASDEMLDSLWSRQVGQRAVRLAKVMREGVF
jgi:lysozyme